MSRIFLIAHHPHLRDILTLAIATQASRDLQVVGSSGWEAHIFTEIAQLQPDVIVVIAGIEASKEVRSLSSLRNLVPEAQLVIVDTLGEAQHWQSNAWQHADALLHSDELATTFVTTIERLLAQRGATASAIGGTIVPPEAAYGT
jgi:DNA-binding NarL/FixJ family response regulator